jgi:hypothetical protein
VQEEEEEEGGEGGRRRRKDVKPSYQISRIKCG